MRAHEFLIDNINELTVRKTKKFIQRAHDHEQGQLYGNKPYSTHPKEVALVGKRFFGSKFGPEAVKVALLHDILEDTPYTSEQLAEKGFSDEVIEAVQLLTKDKSLSYVDNINKIINSGNKLAMMVKYCDNYVNYTGDKSHWSPEKANASQKKYLNSLNMLGNVLGIKKHDMQTNEDNSLDIRQVAEKFMSDPIGKKYVQADCKTSTRAFVKWAAANGIDAETMNLAPPSFEMIKQRPELKGQSGHGDGHIFPIVGGYGIDFTANQFPGVTQVPLITPVSQIPGVYKKIGGYFTDAPSWMGGRTSWQGPWDEIPADVMADRDFEDHYFTPKTNEARKSSWEKMAGPLKKKGIDLDKSDERAQAALIGLKKAGADYQAILDREKKKKDES